MNEKNKLTLIDFHNDEVDGFRGTVKYAALEILNGGNDHALGLGVILQNL